MKARPAKAKSKFTDAELFEKARENEELEARIKKLGKKYADTKKEILDEFIARGTRSIERDGDRLTFSQAIPVVTDWAALEGELTPAQLKRVQVKVVDRSLLSLEVQNGRIDPKIVALYQSPKPSAPYYSFTHNAGNTKKVKK